MRDTTDTPEGSAPGAPREAGPGTRPGGPAAEPSEPRGCLFAFSQPPLALFLAVVGALVFLAAVHDLFLL
ncbi:hypothetical protein [Streptomyces sp. CNQ085]|uniref:hypothetical protein n=1 Tax=Streptomyces sp. CNQ085 TaxID=2886944 RepID=UPI001F50AAEE|nr:hypothetical protein [Streptomyces sp. CNQ085]MCI0383333.1 hypothetical protein [Streptomyces sp. CNQ085]